VPQGTFKYENCTANGVKGRRQSVCVSLDRIFDLPTSDVVILSPQIALPHPPSISALFRAVCPVPVQRVLILLPPSVFVPGALSRHRWAIVFNGLCLFFGLQLHATQLLRCGIPMRGLLSGELLDSTGRSFPRGAQIPVSESYTPWLLCLCFGHGNVLIVNV